MRSKGRVVLQAANLTPGIAAELSPPFSGSGGTADFSNTASLSLRFQAA